MSNVAQGNRFTAFLLAIYAVALGFGVYAAVEAVRAMSSSVVGGLAMLLAALILLAVIGWRINFKWKQLRSASGHHYSSP